VNSTKIPDRTADGPGGALAEVVAVGGFYEVACAVVAAHLRVVMELPARLGPPLSDIALPPARGRHPYDASQLTLRLAEQRPPNLLRVGVTDLDLCLPVFAHVYGEAEVGGGVAVVSMHRLRTEAAAQPVVFQRLAKVACHERLDCLMRFAGRLELLDRLGLAFCEDCATALTVQRSLLARGLPLR
jgi:archaemetzincin